MRFPHKPSNQQLLKARRGRAARDELPDFLRDVRAARVVRDLRALDSDSHFLYRRARIWSGASWAQPERPSRRAGWSRAGGAWSIGTFAIAKANSTSSPPAQASWHSSK